MDRTRAPPESLRDADDRLHNFQTEDGIRLKRRVENLEAGVDRLVCEQAKLMKALSDKVDRVIESADRVEANHQQQLDTLRQENHYAQRAVESISADLRHHIRTCH